jgi:hypothetical protein
MRITQSYKQGFIHYSQIDFIETIQVQVDQFAYPIYVKTFKHAKQLITIHSKRYGKMR